MTGGCLLVAFAPDGATGNDDDDGFARRLVLKQRQRVNRNWPIGKEISDVPFRTEKGEYLWR